MHLKQFRNISIIKSKKMKNQIFETQNWNVLKISNYFKI